MDLNELSFDRLGSWPILVRIVALMSTFIFILFLGYLLLLKPRLTQLRNFEKQQSELKSRYQIKLQKISVLSERQEQLSYMQKTVASLNTKLAAANEIPHLIDSISKLAVVNNLKVNLVKPEQEVTTDIYVALPISIVVMGDYHHLALFMSQLLALQKAISFDDFTITTLNRKAKDDSGATVLRMKTTVMLYMRI